MQRTPYSNPQDEKSGDWVLGQLCCSLQLLAAPAQVQLTHFPGGRVVLTDEMALDFDNWFQCIFTYWRLSEEQISALSKLNVFLEHLSNSHDSDSWTDEALVIDPRWKEIRTLAKAALIACSWPVQTPLPTYEENGMVFDNASFCIQ